MRKRIELVPKELEVLAFIALVVITVLTLTGVVEIKGFND